jgi:hypothetical protein
MEAAEAFNAAWKITQKLLADIMHSLPGDKRRAVLLCYFFEKCVKKVGNARIAVFPLCIPRLRVYNISSI